MRLIDADATIEFLAGFGNREYRSEKGTIREAIKALKYAEYTPTIDAVLVAHGHWVHLGGDEWCCSNCGDVIHTEGSWERPTGKYCAECGAKMMD